MDHKAMVLQVFGFDSGRGKQTNGILISLETDSQACTGVWHMTKVAFQISRKGINY